MWSHQPWRQINVYMQWRTWHEVWVSVPDLFNLPNNPCMVDFSHVLCWNIPLFDLRNVQCHNLARCSYYTIHLCSWDWDEGSVWWVWFDPWVTREHSCNIVVMTAEHSRLMWSHHMTVSSHTCLLFSMDFPLSLLWCISAHHNESRRRNVPSLHSLRRFVSHWW